MPSKEHSEIAAVKVFILRIWCYNMDRPFPLKSREDIYKDLEISRQQAARGECQDMGQALTEIRAKYGL